MLYWMVIRNEKTGQYVSLGMGYPMNHDECMIMKSKFSAEQQSRILLLPA